MSRGRKELSPDIAVQGLEENFFRVANRRVIIVEGKQNDPSLRNGMPKAISQAIAISEITGCGNY